MSLDEVKNHRRQATNLLSDSLNDLGEHTTGSLKIWELIPLQHAPIYIHINDPAKVLHHLHKIPPSRFLRIEEELHQRKGFLFLSLEDFRAVKAMSCTAFVPKDLLYIPLWDQEH